MFGFGKSRVQKLQEEIGALRAVSLKNASAPASFPLSDPGLFDKLFGASTGRMTPERAIKHSAVYRCVFLIAGSIAMLPFKSYRLRDGGHRELEFDSPQARLISERPNPRMSPTMLWRTVVQEMLLNGNGIVWIERSRAGVPTALWPVPWLRVSVRFDTALGTGGLIYQMALDDGRSVVAHGDDVLHIPGSARWDMFRAMSPIEAYSGAVETGLAAEDFAASYFANGSSPDGYVKFPGKVDKTKADEIRDYWRRKFGGPNRFAGPAVLSEGGEFATTRINAADAQLVESRSYSVEDICRLFGVPPHMAGQVNKSTSFGKGLEEQTQSFVDYTIGPHLRAIEDEVGFKLYGQRIRFAEFDREAFVRGDLKSRMESYAKALGGASGPGVLTQNEVRRRLNEAPIPGGDTLVTWPPTGSPPPAPKEPPENAEDDNSAADPQEAQ